MKWMAITFVMVFLLGKIKNDLIDLLKFAYYGII